MRRLRIPLALAVFASLLAAIPAARAWQALRLEADALVESHRRHKVAHPGWSFPARVWSAPAEADLPGPRFSAQARARGYVEACPPVEPGQFCPRDGAFVPRGGRFPEGVQPPGVDGWSRPLALEPVLLGWLVGPQGELREHLPLEQAPEHLLAALVISEDEDFYQHFGVNPRGVLRAGLANLRGGGVQQGASTLTMQLVRNLTQDRERSLERKLREAGLAVAVERRLSKDEVLGLYLDVPYLGQHGSASICGFQAAARYYWGIDATELSLAQAATLVAILPAPGRYAPDRFPDEARARRDRLLRRMGERGWAVEAALAEPIAAHPHPLEPERHPAYVQAVRSRLEQALPAEVLYGAGLEVHTAMDLVAQRATEAAMSDTVTRFRRIIPYHPEPPLQGVAVLLSAHGGHLVALFGGDQQASTDFNRATQARRQPGSSFKPLVYALAFERGLTADHTLPNSPRRFASADGWSPRNVGGEYTATASMAYGLAWSQNIATASLLDELGGPEPLIALAGRLGFDTSSFPHELGLALGQAEVTPLEMGRAVATVLNEGRLASGSPVRVVVDAAGQVRLDDRAPGEAALTPEVAALTRDLMRGVVDYGTGGASRGADGKEGYRGPSIGKTGTTDDEKDLWFVGGTSDFAGVVWLGFDQPSRIGASASDLAAPAWGWWMRAVSEGLPHGELGGLPTQRRWICTVTGRNPNETCRGIGAPFLPGTAPGGVCPLEHPPEQGHQERESLFDRIQRQAAEAADLEAADPEAADPQGAGPADGG